MKNKVLYFSLYDFANSAFTTIIITFIFSTYFSQQIAPSNIIGQSYWGWTIGASGFLVAILGPIIGSISDKNNYNVYFLRTFTALCILTTCLLWFSKPSINFFYYTLVVVGIANFFYEMSLIFYNSLLIKISSREKIGKSLRIVTSRSHPSEKLNTYLKKIDNYKIIPRGSSLKF